MNKIQTDHFTPTIKSIKPKNRLNNNLKENLKDFISIYNQNEKENQIKNKENIIKKKYSYHKRKNKSENTENLEKRNISPLLQKFRNFYSLLYKNKHRTHEFEKNKKNEGKNISYSKNVIKKEENNFELDCMNINKIDFLLNSNDVNYNKKEKNNNIAQEKQNDKLLYLKTTNGIKSMQNSFYYSSRMKMLNNMKNKNSTRKEPPKYNSNILYNNIIKKFPSLLSDKDITYKIKDINKLNLPSIPSNKKNININLNDCQKISPYQFHRPLIEQFNKNNTFFSNSNKNFKINSQLSLDYNQNNYNKNMIQGENDNHEDNINNNFFSNDTNSIRSNSNKKHLNMKDLKFRNQTKIYSIKKNFGLEYLYDIPPINFYKDNFYYYNIYPSNCGWLIKKCLKHRLKWKECHCNNTNLFNLKWKEAVNNNEFLDLGLNKTQIINHFEYQSCISNKYKLFYNFSKYCEEKNINVFKYLPFTIILDISNFGQYLNIKENFKKMFNNIKNYLFDSNSINNKIFDRRKLPYKSLFPNKDDKFGIKLYCEIQQSHYIGKNLWIVKAPNLNRGRCVKVFNSYNDIFAYIKKITEGKADEYDIDEIKKEEYNTDINNIYQNVENISNEMINKNEYENKEEKEYKYQSSIIIIQKYIEKPFLYKGRKCDIRIWVLLTHKMDCYIFKEGHLKASSVNYDTNNFDSFVHLTNYSLQKYNKSFSKFEKGNEISFKLFQEFINSQKNPFNFYEEIFPKFIDIIKHTMLCSKNKINLNNRNYCFEIFGYDFMMDEDKNIYLIEINTNPGLEISSELIGELVPRMIDDALLLTIDDLFPTEYSPECLNEDNKYKSKFHVNGYKDDENMWDFICNIKKNIDKDSYNSISFNFKNFKKYKKKIKIKKMKHKK